MVGKVGELTGKKTVKERGVTEEAVHGGVVIFVEAFVFEEMTKDGEGLRERGRRNRES